MTKLKMMRRSNILSQAELAELTGLGINTIRSLEQGWRNINKAELTTLLKLCNALDCRLQDILDDQDTLAELARYENRQINS